MKTVTAKNLKRGDVIRTPEEFLDPMEDPSEHVVTDVAEDVDGLALFVDPNPFMSDGDPWRFAGSEQVIVVREGESLPPKIVELPAEPVTLSSPAALRDNDDPRQAFALARARLRALGYVLGSVRLDKFREGDVLMVSGAGTLLEVESVDGQTVKFRDTEPAMRIDPGHPFICLRPVRS